MRARFLPGALQKHRFKQAAGDPLEAISILTDPSIPEESNLVDASDAGRLADPSAVTDSTLDSGRSDSSANLSTSPFAISLDFFSGPMDLLLHLVHQQELPIEQVSMKQLAEQYLAVITSSSVLDLDLASEYLVIAATLLSLKSESLLPNHSGLNGEELPIEERSEAFYEELRARLQAYEQTKHQARLLMETPQLGADVFTRVDRKALLPTPEMLAEPEEPSALALLFGRLLKRVGEGMRSFHVRLDSISVVSYMMKILDSFSVSLPTSGGNNSTISALTDPATEALVSASRISAETPTQLSFRALVEKFSRLSRGDFSPATAGSDGETAGEKKDPANSESIERPVVIGSFIAVLELVKRGLLRVSQQNDRADIEIMLGMTAADEVESDSLTSEFDLTDSGDQKGSDQRGSELKGSAQGSAAQIVGTQNSAIVNSGAINADLESRKNSHNLSLANQRAA